MPTEPVRGKYNVVKMIDDNNVRHVISTHDTYEEAITRMKQLRVLKKVDLIGPDGRFCTWMI